MPIRYFGLAQSATIFPERLAKVANRYNRIPMAVFNPNEASDQQLNWTIPRDGGVALYRSSGYPIIEFDTGQWERFEALPFARRGSKIAAAIQKATAQG